MKLNLLSQTIRRDRHINLILKFSSIFFGYGLWLLLSKSHIVIITQTIPIAFINLPVSQHLNINAPQTIKAEFHLKRSEISHLANLALNIDGNTLQTGENELYITNEILQLPPTISLVHYQPCPLIITVKKDEQ